MAYGKLAEGDRVWTAVAGPAASADINELQDQLRAMCGPRKYAIQLANYTCIYGDWVIDEENGGNPMRWEEETHTASSLLVIPIDLASGCELTSVTVWIKGAAASTGGDISLCRQPADGSAGLGVLQVIDDSDPWAHAAITAKTASGLSIVIDGDYNYFVLLENATGGPIGDSYVYGCVVTAQFGN